MNGPDGVAHYWADKPLLEKLFRSHKRENDGMEVFCSRVKAEVVFIQGDMDGVGYESLLSDSNYLQGH